MRRWWSLVILIAACAPTAVAPSPHPTSSPALVPTATARPAPTRAPSPSPATETQAIATSPAARPSAQIHYVAIGASDTVGVGAIDPSTGSWPSRIAALLPPGSTYRNLGVSGSLTAQAQREQVGSAVRDQPTIVTIWLAVNDLNAQVPARDHSAVLASIVDALVAGTPARLFVGNVPDLRAVPAFASADQTALFATIGAYNAGIAAAAARHPERAAVVDLFTGSADLTTQITVSPDGFHPSDAGYALIAQRFADAMRKAGVPLR